MEDPFIGKLVDWGKRHDSVRAAILTSTRATTGKATDEFSDYDVIYVVEDVRDYLDDDWLGDFGEVLTVYRDPVREEFGHERFTRVTQYENGLKIDFSVCATGWLREAARQPKLPDELDVGYRVLLDKDGLAAGLPPFTRTAYVPEPPTEAVFQEEVMNFFSNTPYVAKYICRNDLLPLMHMQDMLRQGRLRQMLVWKLGIESGWTIPEGIYGRGLAERLDKDTQEELRALYTGPSTAENWEALFRTIALYGRAAREVGTALGFSYPEELEERNLAYLRRVKARHEAH